MPAEARSSFQFDADTSAMNAKLEASKEAADSIGQAFVKGAIGLVKVTTAAGALLTVTGAIKDAWMEILQTQEEAARRTIAATPGRAALLARATSPEDRDRLNAAVNATRSETGVDEATATSFQMEIEKGGNQDVRAQIAQFKFLGADITGVADAIGNVRDKFHLTADEMPKLIDKMVVAAKNSEGTVQDFAQTIAQVGEASKGSGTSLDETAAILSNVGGKDVEGFKKGINALATGAINTGYDKKGGILGFVDNLASSGKSEKQLLAATGGVQGYDAYKQIIANRAGIDQSKRDLAGAGGATTSAVAAVGNDQLTGSAQGLGTAEENKRIAEEQNSSQREIDYKRRQAKRDEQYQREFGSVIGGFLSFTDQYGGGNDDVTTNMTPQANEKRQDMILIELRKGNRNTAPPPPMFRGDSVAHPEITRPTP